MKMMLHKIPTCLSTAFLLGKQYHFIVGQRGRQLVQCSDTLDIRYGFNNRKAKIVVMTAPCI